MVHRSFKARRDYSKAPTLENGHQTLSTCTHTAHSYQTMPLPQQVAKYTRQKLSPLKNGPAQTYVLFVAGEKRVCLIFNMRMPDHSPADKHDPQGAQQG